MASRRQLNSNLTLGQLTNGATRLQSRATWSEKASFLNAQRRWPPEVRAKRGRADAGRGLLRGDSSRGPGAGASRSTRGGRIAAELRRGGAGAALLEENR